MVLVEDVLVETSWTCSHCKNEIEGATSHEGQSLICPKCGAPKKNEEYVIHGDPTKDKILEEGCVPEGKNWECEFCGGESRTDRITCSRCGAKRKAPLATGHQATTDVIRETTHQTTTPPVSPVEPGDFESRKVPPSTPLRAVGSGSKTRWVGWSATAWALGVLTLGILAVVALILGVVAGIGWLMTPQKTTAIVESIQWQRTETLLELRRHPGSGWRDDNGNGKDVLRWGSCETRQDGMMDCNPYRCNPHMEEDTTQCTGGNFEQYNCRLVPENYNCRDVPDRSRCRVNYTNNGNGTARRQTFCETKRECQTRNVSRCDTRRVPRVCQRHLVYNTCYNRCPRMRTWCNYTYQSWDVITTQALSGNDHSPRWFGLTTTGTNQRIEQSESFLVNFRDTTDHSKTWTTHPTVHDYESYHVGQRWELSWVRGGPIMPLRLLVN